MVVGRTNNSTGDTEPLDQVEAIGSVEIELMQLLHRSSGGFTAFAVGDDSGMFPQIAVRSNVLAGKIPPFTRDGYLSINQAGRVREGNGKDVLTGKPMHRTDTIQFLCAAYADLDFYTVGLRTEEVIAELNQLKSRGVIPPPSLLVFSGRGLWVLWLLGDEKRSNYPVRTTKKGHELQQHAAIQEVLHRRLARLGADKCAANVVRYIRIPGSLNTKSDTIVRWEIQVDDQCHMPRYTLAELLRRLDVSHEIEKIQQPALTATQSWRDPQDGPVRGQAGWRGLRDRRKRDLNKLCTIRNGFSRGCRNHAIFYYGILMSQSGVRIQSALQRVDQLNATCHPPLRKNAVHVAVASAYSRKYRRLRDQTVADWFDITPSEAAQLECKTVANRFQSPAEAPAPPSKVSRRHRDTIRIESRREAIRRIIAKVDEIPTTRKMATLLLTQHGIAANYVTIAQDYKTLSVSSRVSG